MKLVAPALAALLLAGCARELPRDVAAVESVGMQAAQTGSPAARQTLARWAGNAEAPLAAVAARELGLALAREPGREREAGHWLARAAAAGDGEAAYTLAESYRFGGLGHAADATQARPWYLLAMRAGHAGAMLALARSARNGEGEPRDLARALALLQQASRRGSAQAMYLLAQAYADGEGTAPDAALARHWLEQAAEQHHPAAMQDWALALEDGRLGVAPDAQAAREQWREAGEERRNRWNLR
jgi:TPR repeat protein